MAQKKSSEPGAGTADYKVAAPSNPHPLEQDMHTSKDKPGTHSTISSASKSLSADTGITMPEAEEDQSILRRLARSRADYLDFILNPAAYNKELRALEAATARLCGLYRSNIWRDVLPDLSTWTMPMEECITQRMPGRFLQFA
jgi:hypothetical protein